MRGFKFGWTGTAESHSLHVNYDTYDVVVSARFKEPERAEVDNFIGHRSAFKIKSRSETGFATISQR
jgi:hypothetical protein